MKLQCLSETEQFSNAQIVLVPPKVDIVKCSCIFVIYIK